jgi:DNA replication and repair protein RecF
MRIVACTLRDFRCYGEARIALGDGLTVVAGPNGAGKTNLLEALYFGCTARSCRTANEREIVRFGSSATRVEIDACEEDGDHQFTVGLAPGDAKRITVDGAPVDRLLDVDGRPLVSVFLPDRLELIKGPPAVRRAHLDQFVAAMWPTRVATRRAYAQALAQRNALVARIRAGGGAVDSLQAWDLHLARHGIALMADRAEAADALADRFTQLGAELGVEAELELAYRPRSRATEPEVLAGELAERVESDLARGFTTHGPHRDELALRRDARDLRAYGSQGQQRLALLALLLAERDALAEHRGVVPLMLLDDVMSELDQQRRRALVERLRTSGGQAVISTTDLDHVPGGRDAGVTLIAVAGGRILQAEPDDWRAERAATASAA